MMIVILTYCIGVFHRIKNDVQLRVDQILLDDRWLNILKLSHVDSFFYCFSLNFKILIVWQVNCVTNVLG